MYKFPFASGVGGPHPLCVGLGPGSAEEEYDVLGPWFRQAQYRVREVRVHRVAVRGVCHWGARRDNGYGVYPDTVADDVAGVGAKS